MARSERKRQEKLLKRRRREKAKKKQAARAFITSGSSPRMIIRHAQRYPIHECVINPGWREQGEALVLVSRSQSEDLLLFASFVVDLYCLGVKDCMCNCDFTEAAYHGELKRSLFGRTGMRSCSVELAHQIIYGALDYAAGLGFRPHKDFALARHVLEPRERIPPNDTLEFGKDGKPLFVAGPHDNVEKIMAHLEKRLGPDGFHFVLPLGRPSDGGFIPEEYIDEDDCDLR